MTDKPARTISATVQPNSLILPAVSVLTAALIFFTDLQLPLGAAAAVPYFAVVLFGAWISWRHSIYALATACTALTFFGYFLSPPGEVEWVALLNRGYAVSAIWITAVLLVQRRKLEGALRFANSELEARVEARTADLRRREARLRGVLDNAVDAIVLIDEKGIVDSFNRAGEILFGCRADDVCGQNVSMLMPEPYRSQHDGYIVSYLTTGRGKIIGVGSKEVLARRVDGRMFPAELAVSEMNIEGERHFIGFVRDITTRKNMEEALHQAQKMEAIGQLTGGIAHDFNNRLTVIMGNLDLLAKSQDLDERRQKWLRLAMEAAERGAELTHGLLAFSRRQVLTPRVVDINALVARADRLLRRTLGEGIELCTILAGDLWKTELDSTQLESAVLNLALNARDAMPKGGKLTIETSNSRLDEDYASRHAEVSAGQYVMMAISDSGSGMTSEQIARAFDPFFTTKPTGKGTGLGLSMVHGFVKQSGGHVKIYSEEGEGTSVKMYFPRSRKEIVEGESEEFAPIPVQGKGETILVVEDDAAVRETAVEELDGSGYRVLQAPNADAALALLDSDQDVDLLFTDVVMPGGKTGADLARIVHERWPGIKVLFTSGYTENTIVHQGKLDEGVEWLGKPYTRSQLSRKIRQVLDSLDISSSKEE